MVDENGIGGGGDKVKGAVKEGSGDLTGNDVCLNPSRRPDGISDPRRHSRW